MEFALEPRNLKPDRYAFEKSLFTSPSESMFVVIAVYVPSLSVSVAARRANAIAQGPSSLIATFFPIPPINSLSLSIETLFRRIWLSLSQACKVMLIIISLAC